MKTIKILSMACVLVSLVSVCAFAGGSSGEDYLNDYVLSGKGSKLIDGGSLEYTGRIIYTRVCDQTGTDCTVNVRANGQGSVFINQVKIDYNGQLIYNQNYKILEGGMIKILTDSIFTDGYGKYILVITPEIYGYGMHYSFDMLNKDILYSCRDTNTPYRCTTNVIEIDPETEQPLPMITLDYSGQLVGNGDYLLYII